MTTVFLHVGTHKTGTTAIQTFASLYREELSKLGLLYPQEPPIFSKGAKNSHHGWAAALAGEDDKISAAAAMDFVDVAIREAKDTGKNLLLSAESLYRYKLAKRNQKLQPKRDRETFVALLKSLFDPYGVEVVPILVFRQPADFIASLYQETVMVSSSLGAKSFREFRELQMKRKLGPLSYHRNAVILRNIFPISRYLIFEDLLSGSGLENEFFGALDIDVSGLASVGRVRESTDPLVTVLKNIANEWGFDKSLNFQIYDWLRSDLVLSTVEDAVGSAPHDLWQSAAERDDFLTDLEDQLCELRKDFFNYRTELFPPPKPLHGNPVPNIPKHLAEWLRSSAVAEGLLPR